MDEITEKEEKELPLIHKNSDGTCVLGESVQEYSGRLDIKMLLNNQIDGFLSLQIQYIDEKSIYYYYVPGMCSIEEILEKKQADYELVQGIYWGLVTTFKNCQEYFLKEEHCILEPEYLFWSDREEKLQICYFPGYIKKPGGQLELLNQFLLQRIDHNDKECVELVYGIYELVQRDGFAILEIENFLKQRKEKNGNRQTIDRKIKGENSSQKNKTVQRRKKNRNPRLTNEKSKKTGFFLYNVSKWKELPQKIQIDKRNFKIGRSEENDLVLAAAQISRKHAMIDIDVSNIYLFDDNSMNGVYLNGKKLTGNQPVSCQEKDIISFADISYRLEKCPDRG